MEYTVEKKSKFVVVTTTSTKLNTTNAPDLKSEFVLLTNDDCKNIILDLNSCEYCDSSGLSAILVANRLCEQINGKFVLTGLQPEVESLIKISLLDTILNIKENIDEAEDFMENEAE
ncbi:MAG: STAS domain-containing protein [Prolixibacteraceae bacterium]|jgi:anti-sigma B factor antagonist|nr:STAS domain-containing protein [Prolixibacteraceae bacterium]